jgi:hypothetical protein
VRYPNRLTEINENQKIRILAGHVGENVGTIINPTALPYVPGFFFCDPHPGEEATRGGRERGK